MARRIESLRGTLPLDHVAVLYRTNAQSRLVEESLSRRRIPHLVLGGVRFHQRKEIKDVLAYLSLAVNPELIGGLVIRVGSLSFDGSVRSQFKAMQSQLLEGVPLS